VLLSMKNLTSRPLNPTAVSLFCGCGGFDYGLQQVGFDVIAAFDIDPMAVKVHSNNLRSAAIVSDLTKGPLSVPLPQNVDLLIAGPPCQGFSTAGKRDLDDPRNELLITTGHLVLKIQPKVVLIENVAAVTSGTHVFYWNALRYILRSDGYHTTDITCHGTEMGVAQMRKRRVMVAWKLDKIPRLVVPKITGGVLRDALNGVRDGFPDHSVKMLDIESDAGRIATRIMAGQKLSNVRGGKRAVPTWHIPEVFGPTTAEERSVLGTIQCFRRRYRVRATGDADPVSESLLAQEHGSSVTFVLEELLRKGYLKKVDANYDLVNSFNGKFRRLEWDKPSYTVDTRFGQPRYFLHPRENRGFTVREAARIQGFPDSFVFGDVGSSAYKLVGNAVPPPLAKCLSVMVRNILR